MRTGASLLLLALLMTSCSVGAAPSTQPSAFLITRTSIARARIGLTEHAMEARFGRGETIPRPGPRRLGDHVVRYRLPVGEITVHYVTPPGGRTRVVLVQTKSRHLRTASGVGFDSSLDQVKQLGHMDCAASDSAHEICLTYPNGSSLRFDLVDGHVVSVTLAKSTNGLGGP